MMELNIRSSLTRLCQSASARLRACFNLPFNVLARPSLPWHETQVLAYISAALLMLMLPNSTTSSVIAWLMNALQNTTTQTTTNNAYLIDLVLRFCNRFGFVGSCNVFLIY